MPDITSSAGAITLSAGGITILGIATGLHPTVMLAGFAGGLWAVSYEKPPIPLARRLTWTCGSAIVAGYLTPPAVAMLLPSLPGRMTAELIQHGVGFLIGFTAFPRLGPAFLSLAGKIISRMGK
jgi:hypothetical protein